MRKSFLAFLMFLSLTPFLSGCFCPCWGDRPGRGYGYEREHHEDRDYHGPREGYRDNGDRR